MKSAFPSAAGALLGLLLLISFGIDWENVSAGGSIDLRNRITGTRVLLNHGDAYHYKWKKPEPPELCDPFNNLALPISRVTVTPTLMALNIPLAVLPYRPVQFIWMTVQWLLLLGTAFLWMRVIPSKRMRWLWAAAFVGFTYTVAWRHHVDRGQAYVLILFLLACWTLITRHPKFGNSIWGGLIAGLLIAVRPPLLLLVGPFVLLRRRAQMAGVVIGLLLSAGLPMLWSSSCWSDYHSGMQTWSEIYRAGTSNPRPPPQVYPSVLEGIPIDVMAHFGVIPFADSSLFALFRSWGFENVPALPVALALLVLIAAWFWLSRSQPEMVLFIGIAAWAFLADLFLPAPRNSYNDPMILNVLALGLIIRTRHSWMSWLLLASWPVSWVIMEMLPRQKWIINLPTTLMIVAAVLVLLRPAFEKPTGEPAPLT